MTFLFIFLIYFFLVLFVYGKLPFTFFQQDEWAIFGNFLYWEKANLDFFQRLFVYEQHTHIIPFSNLFSYFQFKFFGLDFVPYAIFSILLQVLNSFLVFYLSFILLKRKWLGFIAGLLFLINAISHQAITWIATTIGTAGSTFFGLLSLIFFARYLTFKQNHQKHLLISLLMLIVSLGFKETSIFLFLFFPLFYLIWSRERTYKNLKKILKPLFVLGVLYTLLRIYFFVNAPVGLLEPEEIAQPAPDVYLYRILTTALKFVSQSFIPVNYIIKGARSLIKIGYPQFVIDDAADPYIVESIAADIVSYGAAIILFSFTFFCLSFLRKGKQERLAKMLILSLIFIITSSFPFIIIPGRAGYFSLLDGRHLYITGIGSAVFLTTMIFAVKEWLLKRQVIFVFFTLFLLLFTSLHLLKIRRDIDSQARIGQLRKLILTKIQKKYPKLPQKVIFYTESDKAYYGLPEEEKILPFQSGFGQTLLVWYNLYGEDFPACLFKGQYLYVILSEDYRYCEGRGFGYYRKFEVLSDALQENDFSPENVIAFSYDSNSDELVDITSKIRERLK